MAEAICVRSALCGISTFDISAIVSNLLRASKAVFACRVDMEPPWPEVIA
jgi:hypothetical protein